MERLKRQLKIELDLVVTENRSVMLNLLEKRRSYVRLSLHKMFLNAPDAILNAIVHYVNGTRKEGSVLRRFIQDNLPHYPPKIKAARPLLHAGEIYHLKPIYDAINAQYFGNELDLAITWYGKERQKRRRTRITFGQYCTSLRLIKIHRMLDNPFFPDYFVSFVVYHEMLHSVVPASWDKRGRHCFHGPDFKERERLFEHYKQAIAWEKSNKDKLFK